MGRGEVCVNRIGLEICRGEGSLFDPKVKVDIRILLLADGLRKFVTKNMVAFGLGLRRRMLVRRFYVNLLAILDYLG